MTVLWLYAPGIVRGGKLDEVAMRDLTGIELQFSEDPAALKVELADGGAYGTDRPFAPVVWAEDRGAEVLGTLTGSNRAGLVVKEMDGWTSAFSAAPILPAAVLRAIAADAGAHIYVDSDDTVYANRSLLSLTVNEGGPREVRLPRPATVIDLFTEDVVVEQGASFTVDMAEKSTALWRLK